MSDYWNVYSQTAKRTELFTITPGEEEQIRLIARTLGLQYFAVDYVRRGDDDTAVFVDINVYPGLRSKLAAAGRKLGYFGQWHNLDDHWRLDATGLSPWPSFWDVFDVAMLAFAGEAASAPIGPHVARSNATDTHAEQ
jgi:hypothetical protein